MALHEHSEGPQPVAVAQSKCFFFFSSRRRHTRFKYDWSSDVCSSDLIRQEPIHHNLKSPSLKPEPQRRQSWSLSSALRFRFEAWALEIMVDRFLSNAENLPGGPDWRSEERRVGEKGRSRWSPDT